MRKVVAYELLSLDGVAEDPDAFVTEWDKVMDENLGRVIATQDAVLLGRRTYDEWAAFWPPAAIEPFASFINGVEKFVVTATTPVPAWANTTVEDGGLPEFITELRQRSGGDMGCTGASPSPSRCSRRAWLTSCGWSSPQPCRCKAASSSTEGCPGA
jgi:dihydrofolate reductase